MRIPESLEALVAEGVISSVVRPLMSGKEAQIYLVESGGELGVAKIYKDAARRSFKHRSAYTEGRGVRSSRDARALQKRSRYGRAVDEEAWRSAEVDVIYRLRDAGVRVPEPYGFFEGVLVMELVADADGDPAPRLGEVELEPEMARIFFDILLQEVVRMLSAGVIHGDLSEFNILVAADGPVIIDFPQAVDAARNPNARRLLLRDVDNLVRFIARYEPSLQGRPYGQELWSLYERAELTPDTVLKGLWKPDHKKVDTAAVLREIAEVERDAGPRRVRRGGPPGSPGGDRRPAGASPTRSEDRPAPPESGVALPPRGSNGASRPADAGSRLSDAGSPGRSTSVERAGRSTPEERSGNSTSVERAGRSTPEERSGNSTPVERVGRSTPVERAGRSTPMERAAGSTDRNARARRVPEVERVSRSPDRGARAGRLPDVESAPRSTDPGARRRR